MGCEKTCKSIFTFTTYNIIDVGKCMHGCNAHLTLAMGSTENDRNLGCLSFKFACHSQAGQPKECRAEANNLNVCFNNPAYDLANKDSRCILQLWHRGSDVRRDTSSSV